MRHCRTGRPLARRAILALSVFVVAAGGPAPALGFAWGNLVLTSGTDVREYRTDGMPVATIPVPYPPGSRGGTNPLLGVAFDTDARLAVFNGATAPYLSVYDPAGGGAWTHATLGGWSTFPVGGFGGLAVFGRDVVAGDIATPAGIENGLVAFDGDAGYAARRESPGFDYADLAAGPGGLVHALVATTSLVFIFDAATLQNTGSVQLEGSVQALAVAPDGSYYVASGDGYIRHLTAQGASFDTLDTAIPGLIDVALADNGDVVMGTALGEIVLTDPELNSAKTFLVGGGPAFVAWVPYHPTTPATRRSWGRIKELYRR